MKEADIGDMELGNYTFGHSRGIYRMPKDFKNFMELVEEKTGKQIAGIIFDAKEEGYGYNVGFVVTEE